MADLTTTELYKVFCLANANAGPHLKVHGFCDANQSFKTNEEAEEWIRNNGEQYEEYIVLKTLKRQ